MCARSVTLACTGSRHPLCTCHFQAVAAKYSSKVTAYRKQCDELRSAVHGIKSKAQATIDRLQRERDSAMGDVAKLKCVAVVAGTVVSSCCP